jgi:hypothetical protein
VADFRDSLEPLGEPLIFYQIRNKLCGGMTFTPSRSSIPAGR